LRLLVLVPAIVVTLFWVRSFLVRDSIYFSTPGWGGVFYSSAGAFGHGGAIWTRTEDWSIHREVIPSPEMDWLDPLFRFHISGDASTWYWSVPCWLIVMLLGLPALTFLTLVGGRRTRQITTQPPNQSPEPTAVGAGRSAIAVHAAVRRWLSFGR
jgi:hypothetical protein